MRRIVISLMILAVVAAAMMGCDPNAGLVSVGIQAKTIDSGSRAVTAGDEVTTIDAYKVTFTKVEIGNSEDDKYTLWENAEGEEMDIATAVDFTDTLLVAAGTYNYLRFTIDNTLNIDGSIDDAGTIYEGTGSCVLDDTMYLFGTDIENFSGDVTVTEPITIAEGVTLVFSFDTENTVNPVCFKTSALFGSPRI